MPTIPHGRGWFARARAWAMRRAWWLLPMVVTVCMTVPKIGQGSWAVDMGRYAGVGYQSWTRILDGDLTGLYALTEATHPGGTPAIPYFNKPPLPLLVHGLTLHALGRSVWATRLPTVMVMVLSVGLLAYTARLLMGRRAALLTGLIAATTVPLVRHAVLVSLDVWQLLFVALTVAFVVRAATRVAPIGQSMITSMPRRAVWRADLLLGGAAVGLALLCKPLVGLMTVPLLIVWLMSVGRARLITPLLVGTLMGLVLPGVWYLLAYGYWGPVFFSEHFGRQVVERAQGRMSNFNAGSSSAFYYVIEMTRDFWPWLLTTLLGFGFLASGRLRGGARWAGWLALFVGVGWFVLCSCFADKRPRYVIPAFWVWALISAAWIDGVGWGGDVARWIGTARRLFVRWAAPVAIALAVLVAALPITLYGPAKPHWERVIAFVEGRGTPAVYGAGLRMYDRCRYLLRLGQWPYPLTDDHDNRLAATPPVGSLVLYDTRPGWRPGPGEEVLLVSEEYTLTRLTQPWAPGFVPKARAESPIADTDENAR